MRVELEGFNDLVKNLIEVEICNGFVVVDIFERERVDGKKVELSDIKINGDGRVYYPPDDGIIHVDIYCGELTIAFRHEEKGRVECKVTVSY